MRRRSFAPSAVQRLQIANAGRSMPSMINSYNPLKINVGKIFSVKTIGNRMNTDITRMNRIVRFLVWALHTRCFAETYQLCLRALCAPLPYTVNFVLFVDFWLLFITDITVVRTTWCVQIYYLLYYFFSVLSDYMSVF